MGGANLVPPFVAQDTDNLYFPVYGSGVYYISKKGSAPQLIQSTKNGGTERSLVVDSGILFLGDSGISALSLGGGTAPTLSAGGNSSVYMTVQSHVLYYVSFSGVFFVPTTGGTGMKLAPEGGMATPSAIAVDASSVYWIGNVTSQSALGDSVMKVPLKGGDVMTIATTLQAHGYIIGLTIDATNAYWVDVTDIMKGPLAGGTPTKLASAGFSVANMEPAAMAVDGGYLYFVSSDGLCKIPVTGGTVTTLSSDAVSGVLAIDDTSVYYWTAGGGPAKLTPK
jgi:hypothetical protein